MVSNCCVVRCTNYVNKKKGLSFYCFPVANKERCERWVVAVCRKDWQPNHIQESAMSILYQVMNRRIVCTV